MTTDPEIRRASGDDAAAIARCYRTAYATAAELGYRTRLADVGAGTIGSWFDRDGISFVAEDDGALIGTLRLVDDTVPSVERLAVVPERQREGIATLLLDRAEALARERGDDRLRLTTFRDHPFLLEWYRSRGYEPIGLPGQPGWAGEFVSMEKSFVGTPDRGASEENDRTAHSRSKSDDSTSTST
ncbi:GNAT family N-acetyltransferase [Halosolutus halophilus]|uniref:GNAT family N-acetyltransferase n=1 Tax=Halosolutus halophilus TaxID=1552990 RepID=UPI00223511A0|nr:GNAT family N-acetyltransferase [Halosolutus halophilus]